MMHLSTDIAYLKTAMPPTTDSGFFDYLATLTAKDVTLEAVEEGEVVFPKVPLITVSGPLAVVQLLETPLLNLVNYARSGVIFRDVTFGSKVAQIGP